MAGGRPAEPAASSPAGLLPTASAADADHDTAGEEEARGLLALSEGGTGADTRPSLVENALGEEGIAFASSGAKAARLLVGDAVPAATAALEEAIAAKG